MPTVESQLLGDATTTPSRRGGDDEGDDPMEQVLLLHFATTASPQDVRKKFRRVTDNLQATKGLPAMDLDTWTLDGDSNAKRSDGDGGDDAETTDDDSDVKFIMSTKKHHMRFELRNPLSLWLDRKRVPPHLMLAIGFVLYVTQFMEGLFSFDSQFAQDVVIAAGILVLSLHLVFQLEWCILKELMQILEFWYLVSIAVVAEVTVELNFSESTLNSSLAIVIAVLSTLTVYTLDAAPRIATRWKVVVVVASAAVVLGLMLYNVFYVALDTLDYVKFWGFFRFHLKTVEQGCLGLTFAMQAQWVYRLWRYDTTLLRFPYSKCYVSASYKMLVADPSEGGGVRRSTMVVLAAVLYEVQGKQDVLLEAVRAMTSGEDEWPGVRYTVLERHRGAERSAKFGPQPIHRLGAGRTNEHGYHVHYDGRVAQRGRVSSLLACDAGPLTLLLGEQQTLLHTNVHQRGGYHDDQQQQQHTVTLLPVMRHVMVRQGMVVNPKLREWLEARIPHFRIAVIAATMASFILNAAVSSSTVPGLACAALVCQLVCLLYFLTVIQLDIVLHNLKTIDFWITAFNMVLVEVLTGFEELHCNHNVPATVVTAIKLPFMALLCGSFDAACITKRAKGILATTMCVVNIILLAAQQWRVSHGDTDVCPYDFVIRIGHNFELRYTPLLMNVEINFMYYYGRMAYRYLWEKWAFGNLQFGSRRVDIVPPCIAPHDLLPSLTAWAQSAHLDHTAVVAVGDAGADEMTSPASFAARSSNNNISSSTLLRTESVGDEGGLSSMQSAGGSA